MTYVVKLDYATFAFGAGAIDLSDIESGARFAAALAESEFTIS